MTLSKFDIEIHMSSSDYTRGQEYYKKNKVRSLLVKVNTKDTLLLRGEVDGSFGNVYQQSITIVNESVFRIRGACSCPVSLNCKHVVAVCLEYVNGAEAFGSMVQPKAKSVSMIEKWLEDFDDTAEEKEKTNEYFVTYRLFSKDRNKDELKFYKTKYLKNGTLGKGTRMESYKFVDSYYYREYKVKEDDEIAALAKQLDFHRWGSSNQRFEGVYGAVVLGEIIKTQRCYYDESKVPLRLSEEKITPELNFKLYKGEYSLKSNIDKDYKLLNTKPPYILNIQTNTIHEFAMNIDTFEKLKKLPKIPKDDISKVYKQIVEKVDTVEIKAPKGVKVQKIEVKPVPHIHFSTTSFSLDFDYEGKSVPYFAELDIYTFYEEDEKIEIYRDKELEKQAKEKIQGFGFELTQRDKALHVELQSGNKQVQLQAFKTFMQTHVQALEDANWLVSNKDDFRLHFEENHEIIVANDTQNDWFSLSFNLEINDVYYPIAPLVSSIIEEFDNFDLMPEFINVEVSENNFVELQTKQIRPIIQTIIELLDKQESDGSLKVAPFDAHMLSYIDESVTWRGSKDILELSKKLKNFKGIQRVEPPKALNATLRDYQQDGLNWLNFLHAFKFNGILADDMGLGKTIQTLAHLSRLKENNDLEKPVLVVMPTSLIANWKNEIVRFTPNLKVLSLHGNDRGERFCEMKNNDVLLTSYGLILRDKEHFENMEFSYIILDEAQKIKNPKTKMAIAIKKLKSEHKLALSGTPIENHLGELWSIFSFLMPGFLDTLSFFKKYYQTPIEKERIFSKQELLNKRIKPFIIRRTKELVAKELPAKSEIIKYTQFEAKQSALYESIRVTMEEKVRKAVEHKGLGSSHITLLDALLKLRQVCCDPSLLKIKEAQKVGESAKLQLFLDLVEELLAEGRKILVFSQFTTMLKILEEKIKEKNISYTKLTGSTTKREKVIEEFTSGSVDIFLISLKAGGVGLNLTQADTVIHYDPWWNPAVENQATDRAYRIGQTKAVFVYKLIVENTIEEKILELQKKKKAIGDGIYDANKQQDDVKLSGNELLDLLK
ncbi:DEAD/DEAH box helicase family protein [Sulfurimonas sp. SAG-AH-194-I05]|nr:DEAD/DEAH box helicase [Sulfurimonas sp. SAG-AH-194-I05]MDF1874195.1 DEAD/DEAH box helicase family protein [Sulfurimonas sp. SAG-AH-194-I05]